MEDRELLDRMWAGMRRFFTLTAADVLELDGVAAMIQPATPDRSLFNGVFAESPEALADALTKLERAYREAGVRAWTVWFEKENTAFARVLERAGHKLDAEPMAMGLELTEVAGSSTEIELDLEATLADLAHINDAAYGYSSGAFGAVLPGLPPDSLVYYVAKVDGVQAACVPGVDTGEDFGVYGVATLAEARGRGLARGLMRLALADSCARGCTTSTLQSTRAGHPLYTRLGYRDLGRLQMWERRERPG